MHNIIKQLLAYLTKPYYRVKYKKDLGYYIYVGRYSFYETVPQKYAYSKRGVLVPVKNLQQEDVFTNKDDIYQMSLRQKFYKNIRV